MPSLFTGVRQDNLVASRPGGRFGWRFFADDDDEFELEALLQAWWGLGAHTDAACHSSMMSHGRRFSSRRLALRSKAGRTSRRSPGSMAFHHAARTVLQNCLRYGINDHSVLGMLAECH